MRTNCSMKNKLIVFFLFFVTCFFSQEVDYHWPIDSPRVLTGNYCELRPNHFHSGIDFSTKGLVNLPVYSVDFGYGRLIKINSVDFGVGVRA